MASFDWDPKKDAENQKKHGVSFSKAQHAFADPNRVIAKDVTHSTIREARYFCFGELGDGCRATITVTGQRQLRWPVQPRRRGPHGPS